MPRGEVKFLAYLLSGSQTTSPPEITTTIDSATHYSGKKLELVVDNIFTTPEYRVNNIRVITGVSDHCAVSGEVEKIT